MTDETANTRMRLGDRMSDLQENDPDLFSAIHGIGFVEGQESVVKKIKKIFNLKDIPVEEQL